MSVKPHRGSWWEQVVLPRRREVRELARAKRAERARLLADAERLQGLRTRLVWAHGPSRAAQIMAGEDAAARADERAWERLGWGAKR